MISARSNVTPYEVVGDNLALLSRKPITAIEGYTAMSESIPQVAVTTEKDVRIVEFTNSKILDEGNITDIGATLTSLIDEKPVPKLLLDFSTVEHLSSAALGMLISANKRIKQKNGQLRLANIKPQIFEVFVITKLNNVFRILPNRAEAISSFAI